VGHEYCGNAQGALQALDLGAHVQTQLSVEITQGFIKQ
jgi:hypothetical protein